MHQILLPPSIPQELHPLTTTKMLHSTSKLTPNIPESKSETILVLDIDSK